MLPLSASGYCLAFREQLVCIYTWAGRPPHMIFLAIKFVRWSGNCKEFALMEFICCECFYSLEKQENPVLTAQELCTVFQLCIVQNV